MKRQDYVPSLEILSQSGAVNDCNLDLTIFCLFFFHCLWSSPGPCAYDLSFVCLLSLKAEFNLIGGQCFPVHIWLCLRGDTLDREWTN